MFKQIDSVKMAYNICERPERGTCMHEANWSASNGRRTCYFEKAGTEKIDIETDVRASE